MGRTSGEAEHTGSGPLAIVMIGGLVTSTLFTLFDLPALYAFVHHRQERLAARRMARKPAGAAA